MHALELTSKLNQNIKSKIMIPSLTVILPILLVGKQRVIFKMDENVRVAGTKLSKSLYFPYKTSFWENKNFVTSDRF